MQESVIFPGCGTICSNCEWFKNEENPQCLGCTNVKGKPFWGECKLYACILEKGIKHCGLCKEFPCDLFIDSFDPSKGPVRSVIKVGILAYRAKHGDKKAIKLFRKIVN
jgi:hypothetical protein